MGHLGKKGSRRETEKQGQQSQAESKKMLKGTEK